MNKFDILEQSSAEQAEAVRKAIEEETKRGGGFERDTRFLNVTKTSKGTRARGTIRFLPNFQGGMPYEKITSYHLKPSEKLRIFKSPEMVGRDENPVLEFQNALWDKRNQAKGTNNEIYWKDMAKALYPKHSYISLVYVMDMEADEDKDQIGKVKIYQYGPQIFNIIQEAGRTKDEFGQKLDPINFYSVKEDGSDFGLLFFKDEKNGFGSWEKSKFLGHSAMFGGDDDQKKAFVKMNEEELDSWDLSEIAKEGVPDNDWIVKQLKFLYGDVYTSLMGNQHASVDVPVIDDADEELYSPGMNAKNEEPQPKVDSEPEVKKEPTPVEKAADLGSDDDLADWFGN